MAGSIFRYLTVATLGHLPCASVLPGLSRGLIEALLHAPIEPQSVQPAATCCQDFQSASASPTGSWSICRPPSLSKHGMATLCQTEVATVDPPLAKAGSASTCASVQGRLRLPGRAAPLSPSLGLAAGAPPTPLHQSIHRRCSAGLPSPRRGLHGGRQVPRAAFSNFGIAQHCFFQPVAEAMPGTSSSEVLQTEFFGARDGAWLNTPQQEVLRAGD